MIYVYITKELKPFETDIRDLCLAFFTLQKITYIFEDVTKDGARGTRPYEDVGASENVGASFTSPLIRLIDRGTPGMSTAGSGDVLSGIITGLLGYIKNEFDATCAAAFVNGMAGEFAARDEGEISMTASDTVKHISEAIKMIKNEK